MANEAKVKIKKTPKPVELTEKREGKVLVNMQQVPEESRAQAIFETEMYLNSKIAAKVYKKYGVAIRFHV